MDHQPQAAAIIAAESKTSQTVSLSYDGRIIKDIINSRPRSEAEHWGIRFSFLQAVSPSTSTLSPTATNISKTPVI